MSKAYDRVEWNFLRVVMSKLGSWDDWIDVVMACVSTISYSLLINGKPQEVFLSKKGLRQGYPLSPYLFLLCAKAFSSMIRKVELSGQLHGINVCPRVPRISHLFFAYNSIVFGRANQREIQVVGDILKAYELASGQKINLDKSEIAFSKNVNKKNFKRQFGLN